MPDHNGHGPAHLASVVRGRLGQFRGLLLSGLDALNDIEQDPVRGDIGHGVRPMDVPNQAVAIDHGHERHAPELEQVDFLTV